MLMLCLSFILGSLKCGKFLRISIALSMCEHQHLPSIKQAVNGIREMPFEFINKIVKPSELG